MPPTLFAKIHKIVLLCASLAVAGCVTPPKPPPPVPLQFKNELRISRVVVTNDAQYPVVGKILKAEIEKAIVPIFTGTRPASIKVTIDHFQMASAVQTIIVGDVYILATYTVLVDGENGSVLAAYPVNKLDGAVGLLGLALSDAPREVKAKELSKNIAELLGKAMTGEK